MNPALNEEQEEKISVPGCSQRYRRHRSFRLRNSVFPDIWLEI